MQCTVHTGNSLGIGIIEEYVGRYWMFNKKYYSTLLKCSSMVIQYVLSCTFKGCSHVTRPPPHNKRGPLRAYQTIRILILINLLTDEKGKVEKYIGQIFQ
jgi:hypothetical protein